jgi:hypothetical protein
VKKREKEGVFIVPLEPGWVPWDRSTGHVRQLWPGDLVTYLLDRGGGESAAVGLGLVVYVRDECADVMWLDTPPTPENVFPRGPFATELTWCVRVVRREGGT